MKAQSYRIGVKVLFPMFLLLALLLVLLVSSTLKGEPTAKLMVLGVVVLPVVALLLTSLRRRVELDDAGVRVQRPFGEKYFPWDELTSLEAVAVRGRALITLCAGDEFAILSNSYGNFDVLVRQLVERLPDSAVSPEARQLMERPVSALTGVLPLWFGILALIYILWHQFAAA